MAQAGIPAPRNPKNLSAPPVSPVKGLINGSPKLFVTSHTKRLEGPLLGNSIFQGGAKGFDRFVRISGDHGLCYFPKMVGRHTDRHIRKTVSVNICVCADRYLVRR